MFPDSADLSPQPSSAQDPQSPPLPLQGPAAASGATGHHHSNQARQDGTASGQGQCQHQGQGQCWHQGQGQCQDRGRGRTSCCSTCSGLGSEGAGSCGAGCKACSFAGRGSGSLGGCCWRSTRSTLEACPSPPPGPPPAPGQPASARSSGAWWRTQRWNVTTLSRVRPSGSAEGAYVRRARREKHSSSLGVGAGGLKGLGLGSVRWGAVAVACRRLTAVVAPVAEHGPGSWGTQA